MANFQVSLINPTTGAADITVSDGVLTIVDHSNYDEGSPEAGHARAQFNAYYKAKIVLPSGGSYILGTTIVSPKDSTVLPPSSAGTYPTIAYTYPSGDGQYWLYLYTLPTYNAGAAYLFANTPHVYYNSKLWKALQNSTGQTPIAGAYWQEVLEDALPSKYRLAQRVVIYADAKRTYARRIYNANVINNKIGENWEQLLSDPEWIDASRLFISINAIPVAMAADSWTEVDTTINFTKQMASKYEVL